MSNVARNLKQLPPRLFNVQLKEWGQITPHILHNLLSPPKFVVLATK